MRAVAGEFGNPKRHSPVGVGEKGRDGIKCIARYIALLDVHGQNQEFLYA